MALGTIISNLLESYSETVGGKALDTQEKVASGIEHSAPRVKMSPVDQQGYAAWKKLHGPHTREAFLALPKQKRAQYSITSSPANGNSQGGPLAFTADTFTLSSEAREIIHGSATAAAFMGAWS